LSHEKDSTNIIFPIDKHEYKGHILQTKGTFLFFFGAYMQENGQVDDLFHFASFIL